MNNSYLHLLKLSFCFLLLSACSPSISLGYGCLDAMIHTVKDGNHETYFVRGSESSKIRWGRSGLGSPEDINSTFSGLSSWDNVDASVRLADNRIILFNGSEMAYINGSDGSALAPPAPITNYINFFPRNFQEGIDAAFGWPAGQDLTRLFFFKGNQWLQVDFDVATNGFVNAKPVSTGGFAGTLTQYFPEGLDAAFYYPTTKKVYFFSGEEYLRYDAQTGVIDPGYPRRTTAFTTSFPSTWSCIGNVNNNRCQIGYNIPDDACGESSEIGINIFGVSGSSMGMDVTLEGVAVWVEHPYVSDLTMTLISPSGVEVELVSNTGGASNNFGSGCMSPTYFSKSATTQIVSGTPPYAGEYKPNGNLVDFNDRTDPNGTWKLRICDVAGDDVGTLQFVSLSFRQLATSVEDVVEAGIGVTAYPNPTQGILHLNMAQEKPGDVQIQVVDQLGKVVLKQAHAQAGTELQTTLDLSNLTNGIYFVQMRNRQKMVTERVVVQH